MKDVYSLVAYEKPSGHAWDAYSRIDTSDDNAIRRFITVAKCMRHYVSVYNHRTGKSFMMTNLADEIYEEKGELTIIHTRPNN